MKTLKRSLVRTIYYLLEIKENEVYQDLGYGSIFEYAREIVGFSRHQTKDYLILGRKLRRLPAIANAMANGQLSWTKARQICRVTGSADERAWVDLALKVSSRELETIIGRISGRRREDMPGSDPSSTGLLGARPLSPAVDTLSESDRAYPSDPKGEHLLRPGKGVKPEPAARDLSLKAAALLGNMKTTVQNQRRVTPADRATPAVMSATETLYVGYAFTPEQYSHWEGITTALHKHGFQGTKEELLLVAMESLLASGRQGTLNVRKIQDTGSEPAADVGDSEDVTGTESGLRSASQVSRDTCGSTSAPGYRIIIQYCPACEKATLDNARGSFTAPAPLLATAFCDSAQETLNGKGKVRRRLTIPPQVRRQVLRRDRYRCQAAGCGNTQFLQVHHRLPIANGGKTKLDNLITLCGRCHRALHERESALRNILVQAPG